MRAATVSPSSRADKASSDKVASSDPVSGSLSPSPACSAMLRAVTG